MKRFKNLAYFLSVFALVLVGCSKNEVKDDIDKDGKNPIEQNVGAEIVFTLSDGTELVLVKENVESPITSIPIAEKTDKGRYELGFFAQTKLSDGNYTFTAAFEIDGAGTYPVLSTLNNRDEGISVGLMHRHLDNSLDIYTIDTKDAGELTVQSMENKLLTGNLKQPVILSSEQNPEKKITLEKIALNLKYLLESDL